MYFVKLVVHVNKVYYYQLLTKGKMIEIIDTKKNYSTLKWSNRYLFVQFDPVSKRNSCHVLKKISIVIIPYRMTVFVTAAGYSN